MGTRCTLGIRSSMKSRIGCFEMNNISGVSRTRPWCVFSIKCVDLFEMPIGILFRVWNQKYRLEGFPKNPLPFLFHCVTMLSPRAACWTSRIIAPQIIKGSRHDTGAPWTERVTKFLSSHFAHAVKRIQAINDNENKLQSWKIGMTAFFNERENYNLLAEFQGFQDPLETGWYWKQPWNPLTYVLHSSLRIKKIWTI